MKICITSLLAMSICLYSHAQWAQVSSGTTINLNSVYFPTPQVGYAVGGNYMVPQDGIILKTVNGGLSWAVLDTTHNATSFTEVLFLNNDTGFVIGQGIYLRTVNGGQSWQQESIEGTLVYNDIATPPNGGFVYMYGGSLNGQQLYKSQDMGSNWDLIFQSDSIDFGHLNFIDSLNGFAHVGSGIHFDRIFKTEDGGYSWQTIFFPYNVNTMQVALIFIDSLTGFSGGWYGAHFMKTNDAGHSWLPLDIDNGNMPTTYFISKHNSIMYVGGPKLFRSNDLGQNWAEQELPIDFGDVFPRGLNDIFIIDYNTAVAVGYGGTIIRTTNGGGSVGLHENENLKKKIKVYPNPTEEALTLELSKNIYIEKIELVDMLGKMIRSYAPSERQLDVSGMVGGQYLLLLETNKGSLSKKVFVE